MTGYTGGLRERLIAESVHLKMTAALGLLGWLSPDPGRRDVHYLPRPAADDEPIELNTVGVFSEHVPKGPLLELGNLAEYNNWQWYADVYAEDEAVGTHLSGDIRAILQGKMPAAGADRPVLEVLDFTMPTPVTIFSCDIEGVTRDRPPTFTHPWQQFWFVVSFVIVDVS